MQVIAHRGASGYKPENTLAAFRQALSMGVDMIEFDVYRLKSGELVVIHDQSVKRTTDGHGNIEDYTLKQMRMLDAGQREQVPLLTDVLDLVDKQVPVNIELKGKFTVEPLVALLRGYLDQGWTANQFVVSSFNHGIIRQFMREMPEIKVCALIHRGPFWLRPLCFNKKVHGINFNAEHVRATDVAMAHKLGKKVFVYTVNSKKLAARLIDIQVDGIFTNYPDILPDESVRSTFSQRQNSN